MRYAQANNSPSETVIEPQDIAIAYLLGGTAKVIALVAYNNVHPYTLLEAIRALQEEGQDVEALAVCVTSLTFLPVGEPAIA